MLYTVQNTSPFYVCAKPDILHSLEFVTILRTYTLSDVVYSSEWVTILLCLYELQMGRHYSANAQSQTFFTIRNIHHIMFVQYAKCFYISSSYVTSMIMCVQYARCFKQFSLHQHRMCNMSNFYADQRTSPFFQWPGLCEVRHISPWIRNCSRIFFTFQIISSGWKIESLYLVKAAYSIRGNNTGVSDVVMSTLRRNLPVENVY